MASDQCSDYSSYRKYDCPMSHSIILLVLAINIVNSVLQSISGHFSKPGSQVCFEYS